jgi:hypothetical protein
MPMDWTLDAIAGQTVVVAELFKANDLTIIEGKTFRSCTLIGPANVLLSGKIKMHGVNFEDCDFVCLKRSARTATAIIIRNVNFIGCQFRRLLIMLDPGVSEKLPKDRFITEVPHTPPTEP